MDKLEFKIDERRHGGQIYHVVRVFINDSDLVEMVREFERPFAGTIAGEYDGLNQEDLWTSLTKKDSGSKKRILECECGCDGCWPLLAKVQMDEEKVLWTNFEQPHRGQESETYWDYSKFGPFEFDKVQYLNEIEKLKPKS